LGFYEFGGNYTLLRVAKNYSVTSLTRTFRNSAGLLVGALDLSSIARAHFARTRALQIQTLILRERVRLRLDRSEYGRAS
jgi:hypothetical protein